MKLEGAALRGIKGRQADGEVALRPRRKLPASPGTRAFHSEYGLGSDWGYLHSPPLHIATHDERHLPTPCRDKCVCVCELVKPESEKL